MGYDNTHPVYWNTKRLMNISMLSQVQRECQQMVVHSSVFHVHLSVHLCRYSPLNLKCVRFHLSLIGPKVQTVQYKSIIFIQLVQYGEWLTVNIVKLKGLQTQHWLAECRLLGLNLPVFKKFTLPEIQLGKVQPPRSHISYQPFRIRYCMIPLKLLVNFTWLTNHWSLWFVLHVTAN